VTINVRRSDSDKKIGRRYRVVADGVDLTSSAFYVDGRRRIVRLNVDEKGMPSRKGVISRNRREVLWKEIHPRRVRLIKK